MEFFDDNPLIPPPEEPLPVGEPPPEEPPPEEPPPEELQLIPPPPEDPVFLSGPGPEPGPEPGVVAPPPPLSAPLSGESASSIFSAPVPFVPIALPPAVPGVAASAGSRGLNPASSRLTPKPRTRRLRFGPGSPIATLPAGSEGAGIGEDERMRMILSGLGLG